MSVAGASIALVKALVLEKREKWFGGAPKKSPAKAVDPKSLTSAQWLEGKGAMLVFLLDRMLLRPLQVWCR